MNWAQLIPLIAQVGLPLAEKLWLKAKAGKEVTAEDWVELHQIENQTPQSHLDAILARTGMSPEDPKVKAFAELLK